MPDTKSSENANLAVLIVDDDETLRLSVKRILSLDGYRVEIAGNGREMMNRKDLNQFFAILLDRKLPDGDASKLFGKIRNRSPHSAIVIITGHADMDSTIAAIRQGVDDYLIKPIDPEALRARLASLAQLHLVRRQLRDSESRMRFLVENLPAGAIYVDENEVFINRAVERLTGYTALEISTVDDWFRVLCGDQFDDSLQQYHKARANHFKDVCLVPIVRKDGVPRELKIAAHRYGHHEVWLITDVTELQDAERRLVQSERLAAIGQMVTGLAHESRNALQRARACLDLLELDLESQSEQLDLIVRIRRALGDLQKNYEEVKQYAAPIALEKVSVDLAELLRSTFNDLGAEFGFDRTVLSIQTEGCQAVEVDTHRMGQVFRNILENAMAASPGTARIVATLRTCEVVGRPMLECVISDHGEGMSQESVTRVFEPFYTTKQSGTGLGMAICKRIVDAHDGTIQATSKAGQGTVITIRLPP